MKNLTKKIEIKKELVKNKKLPSKVFSPWIFVFPYFPKAAIESLIQRTKELNNITFSLKKEKRKRKERNSQKALNAFSLNSFLSIFKKFNEKISLISRCSKNIPNKNIRKVKRSESFFDNKKKIIKNKLKAMWILFLKSTFFCLLF
jgi:hypothetical protein